MNRVQRTGDFEETLRAAMESQQARIWTTLPGIVTAVDLVANTVSVQPAIQGLVTDQDGQRTAVNMPLLVDVPIMWERAGGFALTFPVAVNDECLVSISSRCIDSWWQSGGVQAPAELRMHDLSDGFAFFAPSSQPKVLKNVSPVNVQLRDELGTTYIEITPAGIINIISAPSKHTVTPAVTETAATRIKTSTAFDTTSAPLINENAATIAEVGTVAITNTAPVISRTAGAITDIAGTITISDTEGTTLIQILPGGIISIAASTSITVAAPVLNLGQVGGQVNRFGTWNS